MSERRKNIKKDIEMDVWEEKDIVLGDSQFGDSQFSTKEILTLVLHFDH